MSTVIRKCTCDSKYQDKRLGKKNRVHNETLKGYRCTVCGQEKIK